MELTYTVRGADGKEYGPVTLSQIGAWVQEGRLSAQQEVKRSDMEHWASAVDFTELQPLFASVASAPSTATPPAAAAASPATLRQLKSGGSWFYWIAALSLINSVAAFSESSWRFIIGLGATQVFDALGGRIGGGGKLVALALDLLAAGVFILFGVFGLKGHAWAFIVGMILFAVDGLVFIVVQDWLGVGFHCFVLYCLFRGFQACRVLKP